MITDAIKAKREQDRAVRLAAVRSDLNMLPSFAAMTPAEMAALTASFADRWSMLDLRPDDLKAARREFASRLHPDRLPEAEREKGTRCLALANGILDKAHKRLASRNSRATASRATSA